MEAARASAEYASMNSSLLYISQAFVRYHLFQLHHSDPLCDFHFLPQIQILSSGKSQYVSKSKRTDHVKHTK